MYAMYPSALKPLINVYVIALHGALVAREQAERRLVRDELRGRGRQQAATAGGPI